MCVYCETHSCVFQDDVGRVKEFRYAAVRKQADACRVNVEHAMTLFSLPDQAWQRYVRRISVGFVTKQAYLAVFGGSNGSI